MFLRGLWDVSLNRDLFETSQRHLMLAGEDVSKEVSQKKKNEHQKKIKTRISGANTKSYLTWNIQIIWIKALGLMP